MLISLTLAAALAQATPAAGNVYLKCVTTQGETQKQWDISLNEAGGTVDYYTPCVSSEHLGQLRAEIGGVLASSGVAV